MSETEKKHPLDELIKHLTNYEQVDDEGVLVIIARQACDEAVAALREMQTENECLQKAREALEWIRTDTAHKAPEQITVELLTFYITKLEGSLESSVDNKPTRPGQFPGQ